MSRSQDATGAKTCLGADGGDRLRAGACLALGLVTSALLLRILSGLAQSSWPLSTRAPASSDEVVAGVLAWAGMLLAAWLGLGSAVALLAAIPGAAGDTCGRLADRITPTLLRKSAAVLIGTTIGTIALPTGTATGTAWATTTSASGSGLPWAPGPAFAALDNGSSGPTASAAPRPGFAPTAPTAPDPAFAPVPADQMDRTRATPLPSPAPDPRWRPSRPAPVQDPATSQLLMPAPRATSGGLDTVTVCRGDSLWSIAARHLGPGATDAEIALAWPTWYAANRDAIGDDANLLIPGQQLRPPTEGMAR